jgi:hypothetical protein
VLIHLKASTVLLARSRQSPASNFLAARIGAFEASLCYAKITPAALRRSENRPGRREESEAAGANPKFGLSDFLPCIAGAVSRSRKAPRMAAS